MVEHVVHENAVASTNVVVVGKPLGTSSAIPVLSKPLSEVSDIRQDDGSRRGGTSIPAVNDHRMTTTNKTAALVWACIDPSPSFTAPMETRDDVDAGVQSQGRSDYLTLQKEQESKDPSASIDGPVAKSSTTPLTTPPTTPLATPEKSSMWDKFISLINPDIPVIHVPVVVPTHESAPLGDTQSLNKNVKSPNVDVEDDDSEPENKLLGDLKPVASEENDAELNSMVEGVESLGDVKVGDKKARGDAKKDDTRADSTEAGYTKAGDSKKNSKGFASTCESKLKHIDIPSNGAGATRSQELPASKKADGKTNVISADTDARRNLLVKELRHAITTYGRYDLRCANISAALGDLLDEHGQNEHAIKLHKDAVTIYCCKLGENHTTTMDAKIRLGAVLENAGYYGEAIDTYYMVTSMRRCLYGEKAPAVADGMVHMSHALRKKHDYLLAIKELKRALKIYREALGDSHEKVSATVDEIASLYLTLGDFNKSSEILEEVVKLKAAIHGPGSKDVAVTLTNLATSYECSEHFDKAMKALKKAYKIYTEAGGYSSADATSTLTRMAQLYQGSGDHNRASIAYLGVLRGRKIQHGDNHLAVAEVYYKLGHSLNETGQIEKALKCMKEALPIYVKKAVEMSEVETIAEIMHETALINMKKSKKIDAARIFKQELGVRRKIGQPAYPVIARTLNHLGVVEYELSNYTHALKYLVEALTIFQGKAENSLDCAEVLFNTGLVFEAVKNNDRALEAYSEAARIFHDNGYNDDHPHVARSHRKIKKLKLIAESEEANRAVAAADPPTSLSHGTGIIGRLFK